MKRSLLWWTKDEVIFKTPLFTDPELDHIYHRCKPEGLGNSLRSGYSQGERGLPGHKDSLKRFGHKSSFPSLDLSGQSVTGEASPTMHGEQSSCILYSTTGWHAQHIPTEGSGNHYVVGREAFTRTQGNLSTGSLEYGNGPAIPRLLGQQVIPPSISIQLDEVPGSSHGGRPLCFSTKCQVAEVFLSPSTPSDRGGRSPFQAHGTSNTAYVFPPSPLILRFQRLSGGTVMIVAILPYWPRRPWFPWAASLSALQPIRILLFPHLLSLVHLAPSRLNLHVWTQ